MSNIRVFYGDGTSEEIDASVEKLEIEGKRITRVDLSGLSDNEILCELTLSETYIDALDLSPLSSCTSLQYLKISSNKQLQELDLSPLPSCTNLEHLFISGNSIQELDLSPLPTCKNLRKLDIYGYEVQEMDLSPLSRCTTLNELNFGFLQLQRLDLSPLTSCTNLQQLGLAHNEQLVELDLSPVSSCTNLQNLSISYNKQLQELDLSPLSNCTNLQRLSISSNDQLEDLDLSPLSNCKNLEYLYISGDSIQHVNLSPLSTCTNLSELVIYRTEQLQELDLSPLSSCTNLQDLSISYNRQLQELDLSPLSSCSNLQSLVISDNRMLQALDLSPLSSCTNLQSLDISNNHELQELEVSPLSSCTALEKLYLWGNEQLDEVDFTPLIYCTNFTGYEIDHIQPRSDSMVSLHPTLEKIHRGLSRIETTPLEAGPSQLVGSFVDRTGWQHLKTLSDLYNELEERYAQHHKMMWGWRLLQVLGMAELVGYDGTIDALLTRLEDRDFKSGFDFIYEEMVTLLTQQLEGGGTTIFMDVEVIRDTRAAVLIPRILELRESEMQEIELNANLDLLPLALTAHGFRILKSLDSKRHGRWSQDDKRYAFEEELVVINKRLQEANLPQANVAEEDYDEVSLPSHISEEMVWIVCNMLGWSL